MTKLHPFGVGIILARRAVAWQRRVLLDRNKAARVSKRFTQSLLTVILILVKFFVVFVLHSVRFTHSVEEFLKPRMNTVSHGLKDEAAGFPFII